MAIKTINVGHDFLKTGIIKDALHNPLTTLERDALALTLGVDNAGLGVYDTDEKKIYHWDSTQFATNPTATSGLVPRGNKHFDDTEPVAPGLYDLYVFDTAGVNTWEGSTAVQVFDQVWWDGTVWQFIQGNVILAEETIAGIAEIATQGETNTGTDDERFITPLKLASNQASRAFAKTYFVTGLTLVADTPLTVTHALALQNRDSFVASFKVGNSEVDADIDSVDINSITITSNVAVAGTGVITIIGF